MLTGMLGRTRVTAAAFCLLLAACQAAPSPTPRLTPGVSPSVSPGPSAEPVPTSSLAPSPLLTPSATPSASIAPTAEPSPSPSAVASAGPFDPHAVVVDLNDFAEGLSSPVFATGRRDGSGGLLVVEQLGTIRIVNDDGSVQPTPFLDISERVLAGGERGLLGLALHPDYENNARFYIDYTRAPDGATVISEFQADDRFADPASERVLLTIPQPAANHNGGMVAFDSAGMLVIGMGDGGGGGDPNGNGQNPQALLGKMLRIDVDSGDPYAIPADNPFAGSSDFLPEIWALGMRNPWRFSFDAQTGDLWIGDVGQGEWEEVDAEPAHSGGRNYGWNIMEGRHCFRGSGCDTAGLTLPVAEYANSSGCAVTGGYVYRGSAFPILSGGYLYGDYCTGAIWALSAADALANGTAEPVGVGNSGTLISSFAEDDAGELYVVDLGGRVLRLTAGPR